MHSYTRMYVNFFCTGCGNNNLKGFFQDFRQEGANVTIVELRGGMYYCCIHDQGFCHRGNII